MICALSIVLRFLGSLRGNIVKMMIALLLIQMLLLHVFVLHLSVLVFFARGLLEDIKEESFSRDIVSDECFDGAKVRLRQIFHQLGTFERFLNLLQDAP